MNARALSILLFPSLLLGLGFSCSNGPPQIRILSHAHGEFTTITNVTVSGDIKNVALANALVTVNGVVVTVDPAKTWSTTVTMDPAAVFNPVLAELTVLSDGDKKRDRIVLIAGDSVADGAFSPESAALRLSDSGIDKAETILADLAGAGFDLATLFPVGTPLIQDFCAIDGGFLGCLGEVDVVIDNPAPSFSDFSVDVDSMTGFADANVSITNIQVDIDINGSGIAPSCGYRITASRADIFSELSLEPDATDPETLDIDQLGNVIVQFTNFDDDATSGLCDFPLIGDLIGLIIGDIEPQVRDALEDFLNDPDGAGPDDGAIAEALETALAGVSIGGLLGDSLDLSFETPFFSVAEDPAGITLGADTRATVSVGSGPGQCQPPAGSPDFPASLHYVDSFPGFAATTPVDNAPYDFGLSVSASALNQILKSVVECGLLELSLTELDIGGGPSPITAGLLAFLVPEFGGLEPTLPLEIHVTPSLAPVVTDQLGPGGEPAELRIAQLELNIEGALSGLTYLKLLVDARVSLDLSFDAVSGDLVFGLGTPMASDFSFVFLEDLLFIDPTILELVLPLFLAPVLGDVADNLGSLPVPSFLGLGLQGVEFSRQGSFLSLYLDLVPVP